MFTEDRIRELNIAYDLDMGGHSFENPEGNALADLACVVWENPDLDYVDSDGCPREHRGSSLLLAFAPNSGHFPATEWPDEFEDPRREHSLQFRVEDVRRYGKINEWHTNESDHECNCHGKWTAWTGAAGEPGEPERESLKDEDGIEIEGPFRWKFTGVVDGKPYPNCDRCEGDGYVKSDGGEWALYALLEQGEEAQ